MGIDVHLLREIEALEPRGRCMILGDCTFHGTWAKHDGRDLQRFADMTGLEADTIDAFGDPTVRADLQEPLPDELAASYDLVVDAGTICCCFDLAAAWRNALSMVKPNGTIVHHAILTGFFGRGYYSIGPAVFRDLYAVNGYEITRMAIKPHGQPYETHDPDAVFASDDGWSTTNRGPVTELPGDAAVLCIARQRDVVPFTNALPDFYRDRDDVSFKRLHPAARPRLSSRMFRRSTART
jgi:hypothetical protein